MARKILLADDSVTAQNMGRRILTDAGYEVITVNNGSAALKKIAEVVPDLIVLDVYMPGYGGLEVCQRLKESPATARIPVLLTVGKLEPFKAEEAKRVRADAHIIKPFDTNELLAAIIKLEDRIVPQPAAAKSGRSGKHIAAEETSSRRSREKSTDAGSETGTGWKKRLSIPRKPPVIPSEVPANEVITTPATTFQDLGRPDEQPQTTSAATPIQETVAALAQAMGPREDTPSQPISIEGADGLHTPAASFEKFGAELASQLANLNLAENPAASPEVEFEPSAIVAAITQEVPTPVEPPENILSVELKADPPVIPQAPDPQSPNESEIMAALASLSEVKVGDTSVYGEGGKDSTEIRSTEAAGAFQTSQPDSRVSRRSGARWIAEPVTLSDGDSHLILEAEMEKAYAAFAAAEGATTLTSVTAEDTATMPPVILEVAPFETFREVPQHSVGVAETPLETFEAAPVVTDAISNASLQTHAQHDQFEQENQSEQPGAFRVPVGKDSPAADSDANHYAEMPSFIERVSQTVAASSAPEVEETVTAEPEGRSAYREIAYAAAASAYSGAVVEKNIEIFSPALDTETQSTVNVEESVTASKPETSLEAVAEATALEAESFAPLTVNPERESELAAAWQNWKQIRESIAGPQLTSQIADAAAAGFKQIRNEKTNQPESEIAASNRAAEEASAIANIVDSVLAELKPKLMEEITRKLAKDRK